MSVCVGRGEDEITAYKSTIAKVHDPSHYCLCYNFALGFWQFLRQDLVNVNMYKAFYKNIPYC